MKNTMGVCGILLGIVAAGACARDVDFEPTMQESVWEVQTSAAACYLRQYVPYYGKAEFAWRAGEALNLSVMPNHPPDQPSTARFKSIPPAWKSQRAVVSLTEVEISPDTHTIALDATLANRSLQELAAGMEPTFIYPDWHDGRDTILLKLSPVTFLPAFAKYNACIARLLDYGYEDVAKNVVNFETDMATLSEAARTTLKRVADYAIGDERIKSIFIDGHTDDTHSDKYNFKLSTRRADAVKKFLLAYGIPTTKIAMKAHSEWVPVASNLHTSGRSDNRRVEVILVRE